MVNIRAKGQRGEYEAIRLFSAWAEPVTGHLGRPSLEMERNLVQTRGGGYDVTGVHWLALEVKRQENLAVPSWWRQAVRQATGSQIPVLMWRQSRRPWQFRIRVEVLHRPSSVSVLDVDLAEEQAKEWFQRELYTRLLNETS